MSGLNRYFASSTKPLRKFKITTCITARLKLETDFKDIMNNTLFINNQVELDDGKQQLKFELEFNKEWTLYNKNQWEDFNG